MYYSGSVHIHFCMHICSQSCASYAHTFTHYTHLTSQRYLMMASRTVLCTQVFFYSRQLFITSRCCFSKVFFLYKHYNTFMWCPVVRYSAIWLLCFVVRRLAEEILLSGQDRFQVLHIHNQYELQKLCL